jgi:hypothetical protein
LEVFAWDSSFVEVDLVYDFDKDVVLAEVVLVSIAEAESIQDDLLDSKEDWVWPKVLADHEKLHLVLLPRVLQLDLYAS